MSRELLGLNNKSRMSRPAQVRFCERQRGKFLLPTRLLLGFTNKEDALRVMQVLPKRLGKFGLTLHPEKTRLINLEEEEKGQQGQEKKTFDFLGFTHYMGKSRKGKRILKRKTSSKKLNASLKRMDEWIRLNRYKLTMPVLIADLNQKLRGHYAYYGITFNARRLASYYYQTRRLLHKWLNHRGGKRVWSWEKIAKLVEEWIPLRNQGYITAIN